MQLTLLRAEVASAVRAVRAAHRVIAERTDADIRVVKGPLDLTTGTDLASHEQIRAVLETE